MLFIPIRENENTYQREIRPFAYREKMHVDACGRLIGLLLFG